MTDQGESTIRAVPVEALVRELVAYLGEQREVLRRRWVELMAAKGLLTWPRNRDMTGG